MLTTVLQTLGSCILEACNLYALKYITPLLSSTDFIFPNISKIMHYSFMCLANFPWYNVIHIKLFCGKFQDVFLRLNNFVLYFITTVP